MSRFRFANGNIAAASGVLREAEIRIEGDRIASIDPLSGSEGVIDLDGGWLLPGFIDVQVNGGGGVLFNDRTDVEGIAAIGAAHARFGTTGFLPTLISDTPQRIAQALDAVDAAIEAGVPGVLGVHIEGPVLNPARSGIHEVEKFRRLDAELLALLTSPRRGRVLVTLAPELVAPEDISSLLAAGVIVSAGHSDADYETALAAFDLGVTGVTHLFNAMPPLHHRAPGLAGAALEDPRPWCGLIADRAHLAPAMLRLAMRLRPFERMMLVTDAMPSVGMIEKEFILQDKRISVADGKCLGTEGTLAGSDLDMTTAVANCVADLGIQPDRAAAMASTNPAAFLGLSHERGALAPGLRADWVRLDANLAHVETHIASGDASA